MLVNLEAESLLLSSFLRSPQVTGAKCIEKNLTSEAFSTPQNALLYRHLLGVWSEGKNVQFHAISYDIKKLGMMEQVGGIERLQSLQGLSPTDVLVPEIIADLKDLQKRRRIMKVCQKVYQDCQAENPTGELVSDLEKVVNSSEVDSSIETPTPKEMSMELCDHAEKASMIATGFSGIDKMCGSLYRGDLLIVGGGAKAGKSTLAGNIAANIAKKHFVVIFTLEMNRIEFWKRIVNAEATVSNTYWDGGAVTESQVQRVNGAVLRLNERKMTIIDRVSCIDQAFSICRALKAKHGDLGAVVIDYLQMFTSPGKQESRADAVARISRACKLGATQLQSLVIGLSQLNDEGQSLESRGIQRDANMMLNVMVDDHGKRTVVSAYNRNGPMGMTLPISAELEFNRFNDHDYSI